MSTTSGSGSDGRINIPLQLRFDGKVPKEGLDAEEVAAVAEGMAKAVQFVAERTSPFGGRYVLHLTAVQPGSSTFQFLLEGVALTQTVLPAILDSHVDIAKIGSVLSSAIKLFEFLKGKPPKAVVTVTGEQNVVVTNSEGAKLSVYAPVFNISGNAYFHDQVVRSVKPLRKPGRRLTIRQDGQQLLDTASDQYPSIATRALNDNQPISSNIIEATLRVRQPHLDGEDSWRFSWGRNAITAKVVDPAFMEKVHAGEENFRAGDRLRVRLRIEEQQKGKSVSKRHFIDEVLQHERGG